MLKTAKYLALALLCATLFTQCTKDQETVSETPAATSKADGTTTSLGAQVAALPAFTAYVNQLAVASVKFKGELEAQPTAAAREAYIGNLIALQQSGDPADKLQFILNIGFSSQLDYDTWMTNTIAKLNDLYNDPFFDNLTPEDSKQGVADGLNSGFPDGLTSPPNYPSNENLAECLRLTWEIFGHDVNICYLEHHNFMVIDLIALDGCLDDAWLTLQEEIDHCHDVFD